MNIEILEERENSLLNRKEIRFRVEYKGKTPSFEEMRGELINVVNSDKKLTIVDSVKPEFGCQSALGYAKIYKDEESMKVEPEHRIRKNFVGKKEKPKEGGETKQAEEKAEAKPAKSKPEDKAEETKPESKKPAELKKE